MGFIFQAFNLIPVFSATENVELPLLFDAGARETRPASGRAETLTRVGLGHRLDRRPPELSGGEQQRVAIARALAGRPRIVWADEPTGNLDSEMAASVMDLLCELHDEGLTLLLITHDPAVGARADRLITVKDGDIVDDLLQVTAPPLPASRSRHDRRARPRPASLAAVPVGCSRGAPCCVASPSAMPSVARARQRSSCSARSSAPRSSPARWSSATPSTPRSARSPAPTSARSTRSSRRAAHRPAAAPPRSTGRCARGRRHRRHPRTLVDGRCRHDNGPAPPLGAARAGARGRLQGRPALRR